MRARRSATGAAGGIGTALSIKFAQEGWNIVLHYNNSVYAAKALAETLKQNGAEVLLYRADLTEKNEVQAMVHSALSRFGRIDALINNAGVSKQNLFTDITESEWDLVLDTNLKSAFLVSQAVLKNMISNKKCIE